MTHVPHGLHEEFPTSAAAISKLKIGDAHFATLAESYDATNREIHRIEAGIEPTDDAVLEELKKKRLKLKDQIAAMLRAAA
ncbi:hypothetical protein SLNSH_13570 [Alsobacter soli]|uniref:DUF465 domain-containing protein n=1 Tax=Alsobacter soli TaxID=2109933 RepID=A0A2T1HSL5_9HYPH|nr:DUF465 domain-containing protein [Alsobacter soli]PSC04519.1 hypothetical protein SLNSH_13570 [Alsobacter soli]